MGLDTSVEKLAEPKPLFGRPMDTMTAGNSTPLSDDASAVLLASEAGVAAHTSAVGASTMKTWTPRSDLAGRKAASAATRWHSQAPASDDDPSAARTGGDKMGPATTDRRKLQVTQLASPAWAAGGEGT